MALDVVTAILLILFFIQGYRKGLVIAIFSLLGIILGIVCALKLSHLLADWLLKNNIITSGWGQFLSYLILFIGVVLLVRLIGKAIETAMQAMLLGIVNRIIGGLLYTFIAAFILSSIIWICVQMHIITEQTISASKTYPYISRMGPWVCEKAGNLLPFMKNTFTDLQHFFDHINQNTPKHVGAAG
jgi:membrane protein required for colicin V production